MAADLHVNVNVNLVIYYGESVRVVRRIVRGVGVSGQSAERGSVFSTSSVLRLGFL